MRRIILALSLLLLLLTGCIDRKHQLYVGVVKNSISSIPIEYLKQSGAIGKDSMKIKYYTSEEKLNKELLNNTVDVALLPFPTIWNDVQAKKSVKLISFLQRNGSGILVSKNVNALQDFRYRYIGVVKGSIEEHLTRVFFPRMNSTCHVRLFAKWEDVQTAWRNQEVDAIAAPAEILYNENKDNNSYVILWFSEPYRDYPSYDLAASGQAMQKKRDYVVNFLDKLAIQCKEMEKNKDKCRTIALGCSHMNETIVDQVLEQYKFKSDLFYDGQIFEKKIMESIKGEKQVEGVAEPNRVFFSLD